ncbi:hypothetical protein GCK32_011954 [Trichostrongylus colubriformis]|uniref:ATPase AAA-type core domain-containing protein n=1 Tax=Trichostrongylus colubriformis TaxID=6319 RepID=A0AAN8IUG8_TRICO
MIPDELNISINAIQNCKLNGHCIPSLTKKDRKMFKPHVEVQLKKGVAKSQVEGRIPELEAFIKQQSTIRNWVPTDLESSNGASGDSDSLFHFIHGIVIGCTNYPDACSLTSCIFTSSEDDRCMVFVLIDEIESLGMSRDASTSRGDPADSIRAVNALLTQIDRIRRRTNVIVLCTSNMEGCLDRALLDRADVVRHVGQPSANALYSILAKCVAELMRIGLVVSDQQLPSIRELGGVDGECFPGRELKELATLALGLSGRSIRQVPALAWSKAQEETVSLSSCLSLFKEAILEKTELRR